MKKNELREIYKAKRMGLTAAQKKCLEENIYNQIYKIDVADIENIHIFLTLKKFQEIDTNPIIKYLRNKEKKIVASSCNFENNTLKHFYLEYDTVLQPNKYGVPEPVNAKEVLEHKIDLVFVPLLISDIHNFRVGYGKGFYDRFLANCKPTAKFIGLNFFEPVLKIDDIHPLDISLHQVIYAK